MYLCIQRSSNLRHPKENLTDEGYYLECKRVENQQRITQHQVNSNLLSSHHTSTVCHKSACQHELSKTFRLGWWAQLQRINDDEEQEMKSTFLTITKFTITKVTDLTIYKLTIIKVIISIPIVYKTRYQVISQLQESVLNR